MQGNHSHMDQYDKAVEIKLQKLIFHLPIIVGSKSLEEPCFFKYLGPNSVDQSELDTKNRECYED